MNRRTQGKAWGERDEFLFSFAKLHRKVIVLIRSSEMDSGLRRDDRIPWEQSLSRQEGFASVLWTGKSNHRRGLEGSRRDLSNSDPSRL